MRLTWNPKEYCFEAEFQDFQNDLAAVKAAGFKTTGPPDWKWFTFKPAVLEKLRKNRPPSGLTIMQDALDQFTRLRKEDADRIALLAELKKSKKAVKKPEAKLEPLLEGQEFGYNCVEDVKTTFRIGYVAPEWTGLSCHICAGPVYMYEKQEPPTCLWCEKVLDTAPEMF